MPDEAARHRSHRRAVAKPIIVEWRAKGGRPSLFFGDWCQFKRYKDLATANQALASKANDKWFEYRLKEGARD